MTLQQNKILRNCLQDCLQVADILNFFQIVQEFGFKTEFLSPAQSISCIISAIQQSDDPCIAISYRLTPSNGFQHIQKFIHEVHTHQSTDRAYLFGELPELIDLFRHLSLFAGTLIVEESVQLYEKDRLKQFGLFLSSEPNLPTFFPRIYLSIYHRNIGG